MTVPEENSPKTTTTDAVVDQHDDAETTGPASGGASGRTMAEALEEVGLSPDDVRED